jgi:glycine/D-amino acid oxidase-like deaminating enzyme
MRNVWLMGGLGSRGLLYHALLAQLLVEAAIESETEKETGIPAG